MMVSFPQLRQSFALVMVLMALAGAQDELPVIDPATLGYEPYLSYIGNAFSIEQIQQSIMPEGTEKGLIVDLTHLTRTLDQTEIDPTHIYGMIYTGPYPFEANEVRYIYKRFRTYESIDNGKGLVSLYRFQRDKYNSEGAAWLKSGQVAVRLVLYLEQAGKDDILGIYDTFANFIWDGATYHKAPTLYEGPFVSMIHSGDPSRLVIAFKVDRPVTPTVVVEGLGEFSGTSGNPLYEIEISGLQPDQEYRYFIQIGDAVRTKSFTFKTAPKAGSRAPVRFAYAGDSREGIGEGEHNLMGINAAIVERQFNQAYQFGTDFFLFGGDLINGYTSSVEDFRTQIHAWKQAAAGYMAERPVYPAIGNHESLLNRFRRPDNHRDRIQLDRWPYETESAEAVFGQEFVNPTNAPERSDPRRPPYAENVYSFQYGNIKCITFNNNYWVAWTPEVSGGAPEAYIMADQMAWLAQELAAAEADETVDYVILFAQEPIFPNGGHVKDAMWYHGDNNVRAYTYVAGQGLVPAEKGIIEVRNDFVRLVARHRKVAAVLTSDEHNYSKILIDKTVPIGDIVTDDPNGNQIICETGEGCSPLKDLPYPVWYLTCGGAGAPFYAQEDTPWNQYWQDHPTNCPDESECFVFSSQFNFFLFETSDAGLSLEVWTPYGERIDRIENLMDVKSVKTD